ncbi:MAG TPA: PD-(D/E)XK nuclease family protein [Acidimicrobiales bacterium]|nr:PD-(D/E)XK nuclease family protein [Acidimicrobiales bacterium]
MALQLRWVHYGRPAADALRQALAVSKDGDPLAPVSVLVASNHVGVVIRRLLASGALGPVAGASGLAAVSFLTVYRVAELLGAPVLAGAGKRPVSTPVVAAAVRSALAEAPGLFAPVAGHPSTELAFVATYRELRDVSPASLDRLANCSARAAEVVRLHRSVRARLEARFYDEQDLAEAAIEVLGATSAPGALGAVVVYLPRRLPRHALRLVGALARSGDVLVLAGVTGDSRADAEVGRTVRALCDLHGGRAAMAPGPPRTLAAPGRAHILTASDADEEVRAAVRAVVEAARAGTPLERIAVLHPGAGPYARLVHEQLTAAGIPFNGPAAVTPASRAAGRALLGLLALPAGGFRRQDVFAWLSGAQLLHRGRPAPVAAWERVSRAAGVVGGRDHWDRLLERFADRCDADAERAATDPDQPEWRAASLRAEAGRARELRQFVLTLVDDLGAAAAAPKSWPEWAGWARRHLDGLLGGATARETWPVAERRAAERVERAIDRLASLGAVEGPAVLPVVARTLELELRSDPGRVGRIGEGVTVGSVRMGVGLDLELVIVLGLAEGSFPSPAREDSLVPDREREVTAGELPPRADAVATQHHDLLASLAGAARQLLCVPRGNLRQSSTTVPSRWVLQLASALAGRRLWTDDLLGAEGSWIEHVASFEAGIRRSTFPATEQEYRLRALLGTAAPGRGRDHPARGLPKGAPAAAAALGDAALAAGMAAVTARRSDRFTRFDGNLAGLPVPSPVEGPTSATRLERWAACPFAYLLRDVLGVEETEDPEERLQISPLDQGSLVHEILERFLADVLARPAEHRPAPAEPWSEGDRDRLDAIVAQVCDDYEARGLTGRSIFWRRDRRRILADARRFLEEDAAYRAAFGAHPVAAELAFGLPRAMGTVALDLPDGRRVAFRGRADRLDVTAGGTLRVIDYKTGRPDTYVGLSEDDPDQRGTRLQLAVYGLAARAHLGAPLAQVEAEYWFVSARGGFRRIGYELTPRVLERLREAVGAIVAGIESGVFPSNPTASSTSPFVECPYCDPDGLGVADLRAQLEHKQADPAMRPYLDLAEPGRGAAAKRHVAARAGVARGERDGGAGG